MQTTLESNDVGGRPAINAIAARPARRWRWFTAGAVIAVVATVVVTTALDTMIEPNSAAGAASDPGKTRTVRRVTTGLVVRGPVQDTLAVTGTFTARDEIALAAAVEGERIAEVLVEEGDAVVAGQVLVRLERDMLAAKLRDAQSRVERARAAIAQQEAVYAETESSFRRVEGLRQVGAASAQQHDERRAAFLSAGHALTVMRADLAQAEAQRVEAALRLDRTEIRAPADGIVSERLARGGALAGTEPLLRLIRNGEIELEADIPEADLPRIAVGQAVTVSVTGLSRTLACRVRLVGPKVGRDNRLGTARVACPPDTPLHHGVFGRGTIVIGTHDALTIGDAALLHGTAGEASVFVVGADNRIVRRVVEAGVRRAGRVEIRAGLDEGDRVVLGAAAFLREGDLVMPSDDDGPTRGAAP
ncbi:efflux RND transporter periplasmic adaptor subunit [Reyranella sp. CPCC 100927]|uniref:efflux RND transporter periplasmic adaptor subunit n=1 Tax=Reyranella sp. CPCC 100927 TaxID=2599616 RepID=UPI0011B6A02B|nr:efflux RND transporter periplasmic adaptor subunit [Reyranella sp. CPCC 100927]TWT15497.1 efflux RND transporter periplasmic adaptor subunit [Reyranella sp. CPCC 100927]